MVREIFTDKKGWIKIVEAFLAIMLITGIVLVVLNRGDNENTGFSDQVYISQISVLREVQLNQTLRNEILSTSGTVDWTGLSTNAPQTRSFIENNTPNYLVCEAQICGHFDDCFLSQQQPGSVYAEAVLIAGNLNTYNPRQLKLFCWENA